jgi:signal transduction histidine kinase
VIQRPPSLQRRLSIELAALFVIIAALALGALWYSAWLTAGSLAERDLGLRAEDIAAHVGPDASGSPQFTPPAALAQSYAANPERALYAVRDKAGRLLAASTPEFGAASLRWPAGDAEPVYFQLSKFGSVHQDYAGLSVRLDSAAGPVSVSVAETAGGDQLVHAILRESALDALWYIPVVAAVTLLLAIYRVRHSLRPLRIASERALAIAPEAIAVRLPEGGVPSEALPLVTAVNQGLDRLEQGFATQRRFTANAAHELRTPLAIITARLDGLPESGEVTALRQEVGRMNRLVEQLLCVARLDSLTLDVTASVDLRCIAQEVVGAMAHHALAGGRSIALTGAEQPVMIAGNAAAIADALRNLVENGLTYTPAGAEVVVNVTVDATVSVIDHGTGIALDDRGHLFDRFWRGPGVRGEGAGLGLAIVAEIVKAHGAGVAVDDVVPHGARFTIRFRPSSRREPPNATVQSSSLSSQMRVTVPD